MPTGYTAKLHDGEEQTFPEFVMSCARAFGALITMRDDPADAPIPDEFEPSSWYRESLEKDRARLAEVQAWTAADAVREAQASYEARLAAWEESERKRAGQRERYEAMLAQVDAWEPPTAEHQGLKDFMHKQLAESIEFDCRPFWGRPELMSGADFKKQELKRLKDSVARDEKSWAEEQERARSRTEWVRALRRSVEELSAAADS